MRFDKTFPAWAKSLRVGDTILTCKNDEPQLVVDLAYENMSRGIKIVKSFYRLPTPAADFLAVSYDEICEFLGFTHIWDIHVIIETGEQCSVRNCCSPIDLTTEGYRYSELVNEPIIQRGLWCGTGCKGVTCDVC